MNKTITVQFSQMDNGEFKISKGIAPVFTSNHTVIIGDKNPQILWKMLYDMIGLPFPVIPDAIQNTIPDNTPIEKIVSEPTEKQVPLFTDFSQMTASEIINKVFKEKGVKIEISPKSKASILKKALHIYDTSTAS